MGKPAYELSADTDLVLSDQTKFSDPVRVFVEKSTGRPLLSRGEVRMRTPEQGVFVISIVLQRILADQK